MEELDVIGVFNVSIEGFVTLEADLAVPVILQSFEVRIELSLWCYVWRLSEFGSIGFEVKEGADRWWRVFCESSGEKGQRENTSEREAVMHSASF